MFCDFLYFFEQISSCEHFLAKRYVVDTGSSSGHICRGAGAIRALWSAWQTLKVLVSAGVDMSTSMVAAREFLVHTIFRYEN